MDPTQVSPDRRDDGAPAPARPGRARQSRYRKLPALNRMIDALLAPRPLRDGLMRLARTALTSFGADGAYIEAVADGAAVYVGVGSSHPTCRAPEAARMPLSAPAMTPRLRDVAIGQGLPRETASYLAAPFSIRGEIEGYIALGSTREKAFRPSELPELAAFARLGMLALVHARRSEELRRAGPAADRAHNGNGNGMIERAFDELPDAVAITDHEDHAVYLNRAARQLLGVTANQARAAWLAIAATDETGRRIEPERWPPRCAAADGERRVLRARIINNGCSPRSVEIDSRPLAVAGESQPRVLTFIRELGAGAAARAGAGNGNGNGNGDERTPYEAPPRITRPGTVTRP